MKTKKRTTLELVSAEPSAAALEKFANRIGRMMMPRRWMREFVRRNGRLPYRDEAEDYVAVARTMIKCRKALRERAGVKK